MLAFDNAGKVKQESQLVCSRAGTDFKCEGDFWMHDLDSIDIFPGREHRFVLIPLSSLVL